LLPSGNLFAGDGPEVLLVVEDLRILHVIGAVHPRLDREQSRGVADMASERLRHFRQGLEHAGKDLGVGLQDRIGRIAHVKPHRSIIGVDHRLDGVADVIPHIPGRLRVGETIRDRVAVDEPEQPSLR